MAFVILCCRVYLGTTSLAELQCFLKQQELNWHRIYQLSAAHGIRPVIHNVCASVDAAEIPQRYRARLNKRCITIAHSNFAQYKELKNILKAFSNTGIRIVPYKGLVLGLSLYGDLSSRETTDIDLLILPSDFSAAKKAFEQLGYTNRLFYEQQFEDYFVRTDREFKSTKQVADGGEKINIELQWKPLHALMGIPVTNEDLFRHLERGALPDIDGETLNSNDELLLLFAHHGVADVWRKLKHVLDIALFAQKQGGKVDWDLLSQQVSTNKLKGFAAAGGYLSETLFGINIPLPAFDIESQKTVILAGTLQFPLLSTEKKDVQHLKRHLMLCKSNTERAAFLFRYVSLWLKPNMRDMEGIRLPRSLFPLYYIIRRFRFLRGKLEKK